MVWLFHKRSKTLLMDRSQIMRRVRAKNTAPEMAVRRGLHRLGYRYSVHRSDLPGTPDIVMSPRKAVIFVHGCWWHGHKCKRGARRAKSNAIYWRDKIARNRKRDQKSIAKLRRCGWRAAIVWECELSRNTDRTISRLSRFLKFSPR